MSVNYRLENPCHPGGFVRRNIIEPRNLSAMAAASLLEVPRQALSDFLDEKASLSAELALRIEAVFGYKVEPLMEMQKQFDIAHACKRLRGIQGELAARARSQMTGAAYPGAGARSQPILMRRRAFG